MRIRLYRGDGYEDLMNVPEETREINVYRMGERTLDVAGTLEGQTPVETYRRTNAIEGGGLVVFR